MADGHAPVADEVTEVDAVTEVVDAVAAVAAGAPPGPQRPAAAVDALVDAIAGRRLATALLPGAGATRQRWRLLGAVARAELSCARLVEGHLDAAAILAEADPADDRAWRPGARWGVWAAHPPQSSLRAEHLDPDDGWVLVGTKPWCSGSTTLTHALVSADTDAGRRLFAVELDRRGGITVVPTWAAVGMRDSDSNEVRFERVPAEPVGPPGWYVERPGFAAGGMGVAACWLGGARGLADMLWRHAANGASDPHLLAHLGAVTAELAAADALLDREAALLDREAALLDREAALLDREAAFVDQEAPPLDRAAGTLDREPPAATDRPPPALRAAALRATAARVADEVRERVGRGLGPAPMCLVATHAQRVADLEVYVRQHHAERDAAALGRMAAEQPGPPWPA